MSVRTVTLQSGAVIRIRPYRPDDRDQVIRIFSQGMLGLVWPDGVGHVFHTTRLLRVMACAAPAAALLITAKRSSFVIKAIASLSAAAFAPCLAFGVLRRAMKQYVMKSINGPDLGDIDTFYSAAGAGHGSAFWVAELVEPEVPSTSPDADAMLSLPSSSLSLAPAGEQRLEQAGSAPEPAGASLSTAAIGASASAVAGIIPQSQPPQPSSSAAAEPKQVPEQVAGLMAAANSPLNLSVTQPEAGDGVARDSMPAESTNGPSTGAAAPAQPIDAEEHQVRELVAGLVAAAVARFEGVPSRSLSPSPSPSPRPTSAELPSVRSPAPRVSSRLQRCEEEEGGELQMQKQDGANGYAASKDLYSEAAAAEAPPAASGPETPAAVLKRTRIEGFLEPTGKPPPPPPVHSRQVLAMAAEASGVPRLAAMEPPPRSRTRRATIIGHVALERKSWKLAELRRMSVMKQYAGQGIGGQLLETLVQHARDVGFRELVLYTSGMQPAARRLYERGGWQLSKVTRQQNFDMYTYTLDLTKKR